MTAKQIFYHDATRAAVEGGIVNGGWAARLRPRDVLMRLRAASQEHAPPGRTR